MATTTPAAPFTHYASVQPRTGRPADITGLAAARTAGTATDRGLASCALVYVFVRATNRADAVQQVAAIVGASAAVLDCGTAAQGARRVAIDPALIA